ncbi:hypothetical protein WG909_13955 [Peptostreptococcaceae bacterium AGR-M142]
MISNYIIFKKYILPYQKQEVINLYLKQNTIKIPVLNTDLRLGDSISMEDIDFVYVKRDIVPNNLIDLSKINLSKNYKAVMNIPKNTVILNDFFKTAYLDQDILQSSRLVEIDYLDLSYSNLNKGDFIDIRIEEKPDTKNDDIVNTNGYNNSIVLSKKKILEFDEDRMILKLNEEEIQNLGCAVYQMANYSSYIYFTKYVNPQTQDKAKITYQGSDQLKAIIEKDRLAVKKSEDELRKRLKEIEEENKKRDIEINSLNEYIKLNKVKDIEASKIKESSLNTNKNIDKYKVDNNSNSNIID